MTTTVGVDIGGTKAHVVRLSDGAPVAEVRTDTPRRGPLSAELSASIRELWTSEVAALGAGVAGLVDGDTGRFVWGPHVAGSQVAVRDRLGREFGVPTVVDNDANMAAWGELVAGVGREHRDFLLVTLGTGIGGAVVIGGRIYRGRGFAGEWGHMPSDPRGSRCGCGNTGCWETAASGPALARLAETHVAEHPETELATLLRAASVDGAAVTRAARDGDPAARSMLDRVAGAFGRGIAGLIAIFDPEVVVVGGGLGSIGEPLLVPTRAAAGEALVGASHRSPPPIVGAHFGDRAGAVGAALRAAEPVDR